MTPFGDGFRRNGPSMPFEQHNTIISLLSLRPSLQPWVLCGYLHPNYDRGMNQKRAFCLRVVRVGYGSVLPIGSLVLSVRPGNMRVAGALTIGDDWGFRLILGFFIGSR
jgi:hypothetical protein